MGMPAYLEAWLTQKKHCCSWGLDYSCVAGSVNKEFTFTKMDATLYLFPLPLVHCNQRIEQHEMYFSFC